MKAAAFKKLLSTVRNARPSRRTSSAAPFSPADLTTLRSELGQSQVEFALMIGVSVATLRNWEQGRRVPEGPALALLRVTACNPQAVLEALHRSPNRGVA